MGRSAGSLFKRGSKWWVKVELDPNPLTGRRRRTHAIREEELEAFVARLMEHQGREER